MNPQALISTSRRGMILLMAGNSVLAVVLALAPDTLCLGCRAAGSPWMDRSFGTWFRDRLYSTHSYKALDTPSKMFIGPLHSF